MNLTIEQVEQGIEAAFTETSRSFIKSRYPYTYAYDFMRGHPKAFGLTDEALSRGQCAGILRGNPDKEEICRMLADAYLAENNITKESV